MNCAAAFTARWSLSFGTSLSPRTNRYSALRRRKVSESLTGSSVQLSDQLSFTVSDSVLLGWVTCEEVVRPFVFPEVFVAVVPLVVPFVVVAVVPDIVPFASELVAPVAKALDELVVAVAEPPVVVEPPMAVVAEFIVPIAV